MARSGRPFDGGAEIEMRPIFEPEDFGESLTPELREPEERLRRAARQGRRLSGLTAADAQRAIDAVWRIESARLIAGLDPRSCGDVGVAEDLAQDALVAALEQWPRDGRSGQPGRLADGRPPSTAAIDRFRRPRHARAQAARARPRAARSAAAASGRPRRPRSRTIGDDVLRLVFIACHPVLSTRGPGGADAAPARRPHHRRRSRAPSSSPRRRSRSASSAPSAPSPRPACRSRCPAASERAERLASVLEVIYLVFNEGYAATAGERLDCGRRSARTPCAWAASSPR